jgi:hypothetical protein
MFNNARSATTAKAILAANLIGVWSLESFTNTAAAVEPAHPLGHKPQGQLIYTSDGFVSVQMMRRDRPAIVSGDWSVGIECEYEKVASGYIGYCGTYVLDEGEATVCHIPNIALVPNLIGEQLKRSITLLKDQLSLTVVSSQEKGASIETRLCWRRLGS